MVRLPSLRAQVGVMQEDPGPGDIDFGVNG